MQLRLRTLLLIAAAVGLACALPRIAAGLTYSGVTLAACALPWAWCRLRRRRLAALLLAAALLSVVLGVATAWCLHVGLYAFAATDGSLMLSWQRQPGAGGITLVYDAGIELDEPRQHKFFWHHFAGSLGLKFWQRYQTLVVSVPIWWAAAALGAYPVVAVGRALRGSEAPGFARLSPEETEWQGDRERG